MGCLKIKQNYLIGLISEIQVACCRNPVMEHLMLILLGQKSYGYLQILGKFQHAFVDPLFKHFHVFMYVKLSFINTI